MRYQLQPYGGMATRYQCPQCQHRTKTFTRYIDTQTNQHVGDVVGRCSRQDKCSYHFKPGQYFASAGIKPVQQHQQPQKPIKSLPASYIPAISVNQSLKHYRQNNLYLYFSTLFGDDAATQLFNRYRIGTARHWPGATIFWQTDAQLRTHTGKIMLYNAQTGKRVKQPFNHITWAHRLVDHGQRFQLQQCLFGEHLLTQDNPAPIAIVESEKTAMIASLYLPALTWLATGSLNNLSYQLCKPLQGRHVTLYPDLNAADKWQAKADALKWQLPGTWFTVSRVLEDNANPAERAHGLDIADVLITKPLN